MWHNQLFTPSLRIMFQGVEHLGFGKDVQFVNTKRLPSQSFGQAQHSSQRFGVTRVIPRWSGVVTWMIGDGRSEVQSQVDYSRTLGHCSSVSCGTGATVTSQPSYSDHTRRTPVFPFHQWCKPCTTQARYSKQILPDAPQVLPGAGLVGAKMSAVSTGDGAPGDSAGAIAAPSGAPVPAGDDAAGVLQGLGGDAGRLLQTLMVLKHNMPAGGEGVRDLRQRQGVSDAELLRLRQQIDELQARERGQEAIVADLRTQLTEEKRRGDQLEKLYRKALQDLATVREEVQLLQTQAREAQRANDERFEKLERQLQEMNASHKVAMTSLRTELHMAKQKARTASKEAEENAGAANLSAHLVAGSLAKFCHHAVAVRVAPGDFRFKFVNRIVRRAGRAKGNCNEEWFHRAQAVGTKVATALKMDEPWLDALDSLGDMCEDAREDLNNDAHQPISVASVHNALVNGDEDTAASVQTLFTAVKALFNTEDELTRAMADFVP